MTKVTRSYPGPSGCGLCSYPPKETWDDVVDLDPKAWPKRVERHSMLVPTTCFNCESACGLLAWVDPDTLEIRKLEGNPEHPGSRGRNCAKGPATLTQLTDPDRILHPLRRVGPRGAGRFERVSWDEALDTIAARIRKAIVEERRSEVVYHVGRPGEDGFTERILAAWGIDGHNSHTNVCSSSARAGYQLWCGIDRPSPDHANADVILLISAHLETGHYFNPHAQRIIEAKQRGAKVIVFDTRLSNTATHADHWLAPIPGSEAAILLAIASYLIREKKYDREFVRRWWNWEEWMAAEGTGDQGPGTGDQGPDPDPRTPTPDPLFLAFESRLAAHYAKWTFEAAAAESGVDAATIEAVAKVVATAGTRLSSHVWRSAAAGNLGGWQVSRCLFLLNALLGAIATPGGTYPNAWNKFVPKPPYLPPHPPHWNELSWPEEFPLACNEMSFLLPHLVREGRGTLDTYFTRVYNPVWTNPDGFSWIEMLRDESQVGLHVALTPTWSETAIFADLVLPMGHAPERHDIHSYETHDAQWIGFRQPVGRAARERLGQEPTPDTRGSNPGEVWEENELWIELTWRIDPDGSLGIRRFVESLERPGEKLGVDEYYGWIFENSVPGLPERAAAEGMKPLEWMRRHGSFEISRGIGQVFEQEVPAGELEDVSVGAFGRVYTKTPKPAHPNVIPMASPDPDADGRRPVGVMVDGVIRRGFPTPSGKLELWSSTLAAWGWPEQALPEYVRSHVHPEALGPDRATLISTFRLPVHIHTRSANSKWLDELAHSNPLWIHPSHAERVGVISGDLVRVVTDIGYFVAKAWVTEGIRPGTVACSHHMGRWRLDEKGPRFVTALVSIEEQGDRRLLRRRNGAEPFESSDPDSARIWWSDVGVHQNLTFPVHPDPVSGMHCWHQAVRVEPAQDGDQSGDVSVDLDRSRRIYDEWMQKTRSARDVSPDGTRRPYWLLRPLKPGREVYRLGEKRG